MIRSSKINLRLCHMPCTSSDGTSRSRAHQQVCSCLQMTEKWIPRMRSASGSRSANASPHTTPAAHDPGLIVYCSRLIRHFLAAKVMMATSGAPSTRQKDDFQQQSIRNACQLPCLLIVLQATNSPPS
eukprot:TRINITY_DN14259_c0_g1_i1.p1 TRINITY_DN14259_c0_g1~~TRINITY_DN14259_c0_g1_i1.p1  ORF type:complete len:128 (-),score=7.59 TRINITY_DN14259_c0_g1_i1:334-717(-)